jgi:ubiquinone/menaquinone biosynthesis C-methylase UbiE
MIVYSLRAHLTPTPQPSTKPIGIDSAESQIAVAQNRSTANLTFEVGSVYELPFADNSFDLVLSHALFEHLANPVRAIQELLRVLRPGGIAGLCSPDWGGFILSPLIPGLKTQSAVIERFRRKMGVTPSPAEN